MPDRPFPTLAQATAVWARIGLLSFGGPAGQIALMHRILVDERRWLGERRFLHALNYCMLLPGPEAMQLAVYVGWLMHGVAGGLVAGLLFILPGALAVGALSALYAVYGSVGGVAALFFGLKAAVLAIVVQAVIRMGTRALGTPVRLAIAAAAFVGIFAFDVPFPVIVLAAGLAGFWGHRAGWPGLGGPGHAAAAGGLAEGDSLLGTGTPAHARVDPRFALRTGLIFAALWLGPVAALLLLLGPAHVMAQIAGLFSILAVVSFGGAYAVLAYLAQAAVETYGWLAPGQMLDGLGLAETTPGPLILVTQFVGFLAAFGAPGQWPPLLAGALGAALTTWVTFVPSFLFIFLGAPFIERLRENAALAAALGAITAAVVGVILNLAVWFGLHVIFARVGRWEGFALSLPWPDLSTLDPLALTLTLLALAAVFLARLGPVTVLSACAVAGLMLGAAGLI